MTTTNSDLELWYEAPAVEWTEAMPIGNGRLGAMVFGGVGREELQLNELTLWSGGPYQPTNTQALPHLNEVRALIFAQRYAEAEALANQYLMAKPHLEMSYQPAGNLWLDFEHHGETKEYRRSLDLDSAVATTSYICNGISHRREIFATAVDDVLVLRLSAGQPGAVSFFLSLTSPQPGNVQDVAADTIGYLGSNTAEHGILPALTFGVQVKVIPIGGKISSTSGRLKISGADEVLVLIDVATSFRRYDDVSGDPLKQIAMRLSAAAQKSYDLLLAQHLLEHRRLFRRLSISLGITPVTAMTTTARIAQNARTPDPALAALYLQFGRYLMISSSRPGTQPSTLQGIWNKETSPPWGSKYTANINLQMNYWLPGPANLDECFEPLIAMAEDLAATGAEMAKVHYGAPGWVMHHNTDLWRAAGPIDGAKWGLWPTGGAWLCAQLWDHFSFSQDQTFVARLYPVMKGAVEFLLYVLTPLPGTNYLVTVPSLSPENVHPYGASLCAGPAMDSQIVRDLFDATFGAASMLNVDPEFRGRINAARKRLAPDRIGASMQLQEWLEDWDMAAPELHHRHVSHLYGLYPSWQINLDETSELAAAARKSLEIRGDDATGWGIGWRLNLWARLRDGDHAHAVLTRLLSPERTYPNLFDAHPPFQIDGNFGGAAGIIEMLVQSRNNGIRLLPALPTAWPSGSITGVMARGAIEVDLRWAQGMPQQTVLRSNRPTVTTLRYRDTATVVQLAPENPVTIDFVDGQFSRETS